ncbi:MAG TPA: hypothetical protein VFA20_12575 [Myxococcaceae bacterium]|nr:hypothetical protein [Myxococcaceae bacterium]
MKLAALALCLATQMACLPEVKEHCRFLTDPAPPPALPSDLARLDALLLRRVNETTVASRDLKTLEVWQFRLTYADEVLSILCGKLERARQLAMAGRVAEAGRTYQALLVASQVVQMGVAMHLAAQYAHAAKQAGGQVNQTLETFEHQMHTILEAALSEDPRRIEQALNENPKAFHDALECLEQWPARVEAGAEKAKTAKLAWDITFLVVATWEVAGELAEIAASGGPPIPPLPALGAGGAAAAAAAEFSPAAMAELAEAIRRLVASGALDAGVVMALSNSLSGRGAPVPRPTAPTAFQMSQQGTPKATQAPPRVTVPEGTSEKGLRHILDRHAFEAAAINVSKFLKGMGSGEIRALIQEAASSKAAVWRVEPNGSFVTDVDLGRAIGTGRDGSITTMVRVVTDADGAVVTAYPIKWPL